MRKTSKQLEKTIHQHLNSIHSLDLNDRFMQLQSWQSQRLFDTHQDLYQIRKFQPAMRFFIDELYGCEHFVKRNQELIRALPLMCRTMPVAILEIVENAAYLQLLSLQLDQKLLNQLPVDLPIDNLRLETWITAYSLCSNPAERKLQIDLIERIGNELAGMIRIPMVETLLNWAEKPAKLAGYGEIHHFVITGFKAFKRLKNPQEFLQPVVTKERQLSEQWFAQASSSSH